MVIINKNFKIVEGMFEHTFKSGIKRMKENNLVEREEIIDNGDKYIHEVIFNSPVDFKLYLDKDVLHPADVVITKIKYAKFNRLSKTLVFNKNIDDEEFQYINTENFDSMLFTIGD